MLYSCIAGTIAKRVHKLLHIPPFTIGQKTLLLSYRKLRSTEQDFIEWAYKLPQKEAGDIKGTGQHTTSLDGFIRENSQMLPGSQLHLKLQ